MGKLGLQFSLPQTVKAILVSEDNERSRFYGIHTIAHEPQLEVLHLSM